MNEDEIEIPPPSEMWLDDFFDPSRISPATLRHDSNEVLEKTPPPSPKPNVQVHCDNCGLYPLPTQGNIRWKCTNCENYNLCSKCEIEVYSNGFHNPSHVFVQLFATVIDENLLTKSYSSLPVIYEINSQTRIPVPERCTNVCDLCPVGLIRGIRYKCMNCYDFDVCDQCVDTFRQKHAQGCHVLLKMNFTASGVRAIYSEKPMLYTVQQLHELDIERRNHLYKLLQQIRTVLYTVQSDDSGPMGLLPAELKICILKNLCELMSKDSIKNLFHFACTKDTLGMTKEEFIQYMEFVPFEIKGTSTTRSYTNPLANIRDESESESEVEEDDDDDVNEESLSDEDDEIQIEFFPNLESEENDNFELDEDL